MARVFEALPGHRVRLVCSADAPSPFSAEMLDEVVPTVDRIVGEALDLFGTDRSENGPDHL
jgi:hypothetical protein